MTTAKRLGFTKEETAKVVNPLNELLCNYHVHYQKLRNFHWNVKGGDFFDLHENFELLYDMAKLNIDEIAERIRVFNHTPISTLKEYLEKSTIKEVGTDLSGDKMVEEVMDDFENLLTYLVASTEAASEIGDVGTIDLINNIIKGMEKKHWMLRSFLEK
ncbi:MAG: Dps family protein [Chitinophagales bacterium]